MSQNVSENKILANVAERLGLIEEHSVYQKAEEFLRVFQSKSTIKNLNDYSKAVFCLDLASSYLGIGFDKETAIKLSGFKLSAYQNKLHTVEKVLELDKALSIGEVCVQFGCTAAKEFAEIIFDSYKKQAAADFSHPQYVAISVYTACKLKKCKVQKSLFIGISRLKTTQWRELENEFNVFAEKLALPVESKKAGGRNEFYNYLEEYDKTNGNNLRSPGKKLVEDHSEEYEVWKERILSNARSKLTVN